MLQRGSDDLFIASAALDSPHITSETERGTMQQISAGVCMVMMQQGVTMFFWATNNVIMGKPNTKNRPRNMFTPCLHSTVAWN